MNTQNSSQNVIYPALKLTPYQYETLIGWQLKAPGIVAQALKLVPPPTIVHGVPVVGSWFDKLLGIITSLSSSYPNYKKHLSVPHTPQELQSQMVAFNIASQEIHSQLAAYNISLSSSNLGGLSPPIWGGPLGVTYPTPAQPTTPACTCNSSKGVTRMNPIFRPVTTGPLNTSNPFGRRISPVLRLTPTQTAILVAWEQKAPGIVAQALKLVPPPTVGHGSSGGGGWFNQFLNTITQLGSSYLNYRNSEAQLSAAQAQQELQQQLAAYNISLAESGSGLGGISTTTLLIGGAVVLGAVVLMGKKKRK